MLTRLTADLTGDGNLHSFHHSSRHWPHQGWRGARSALVAGCVFGALHALTSGLAAPIGAHAVFNLARLQAAKAARSA